MCFVLRLIKKYSYFLYSDSWTSCLSWTETTVHCLSNRRLCGICHRRNRCVCTSAFQVNFLQLQLFFLFDIIITINFCLLCLCQIVVCKIHRPTYLRYCKVSSSFAAEYWHWSPLEHNMEAEFLLHCSLFLTL